LALAKISSRKEIKRANVDLRQLDFCLKASWRSALGVLQQAAVAMAEWDRNPPGKTKHYSLRLIKRQQSLAPRLSKASS
jgi:hypothetical protein